MIEGLYIECQIGPMRIFRSPLIELYYSRRAVVTRCVVEIPDPFGEIRGKLAPEQPMTVHFEYRGDSGLSHDWEGIVVNIDQPDHDYADSDAIRVRGAGLEKKLGTVLVTESFYEEPANAVARRLMTRTGLPLGSVDIPDDILPHQNFSRVTVARALKQLEHTLERSFGHDMSEHAIWLGESGLTWSPDVEPGNIAVIETGNNLINHTPPDKQGHMGAITSVLLPGLRDSRKFRIRDVRRGINSVERAEDVLHTLQESGNRTVVYYGKKAGWG